MSPSYKPVPTAPFIKGMNASTDPYTQPKGTFPRGSNLILNSRGALDVCDGSQLVHAYQGTVATGRGKVMCDFLFSPTGVSRYYLALLKALDVPLGAPQNLILATAAGGSLGAATYFYKVTAIDGASGETTASNEASIATGANGKNTLTWNIVPNASQYNVYRSTSSGAETLLTGSPTAVLPVVQVLPGALTVSFVDDGSTTLAGATFSILAYPAMGVKCIFGSYLLWTTTSPNTIAAGQIVTAAGVHDATFNGTYTVGSIIDSTHFTTNNPNGFPGGKASGSGTVTTGNAPPVADNTQQTALYKMPAIFGAVATLPVSYDNSNIAALFPADPRALDGGGGGGSGGGGGTGGGGAIGGGGAGTSPTPSGGLPNNVTFIPQMVEFTNRVVMALGNGFAPQIFSDPTTPTNPATIAAITAITVDAFGVVTVTTGTAHGLVVGGNALIAGVGNSSYNYVGPTIQIVSPTQYKVRNLAAIGQGASSGGTSTTTAQPITNSFTPAFPAWSASTAYSANSVSVPTVSNGHYYIAVQGGVSAAAQPAFPTGTGAQVGDGSILWREAGLVNTAAPAPPGCGHVAVYAGSLCMLNTATSNTASGIDGPCALRMSDVNNPFSWNPINMAFLDKDDGTEGMGLASFTITAQGIPPEGSLIVFKNYAAYQIVGIFGSPTLTIQRIKSDMGCIAPRSIQFVPGFGIMRFSHLGFAVFDGVEDRVASEDIRTYLFPTQDFLESDITTLDSNWQGVIWGFQTANPPMYCAAIPIGASNGQLTRILCYDLVLKAWTAPIDLPFPISTGAQFKTVSANPVTILGGFSDGCLSRWQAGDQLWDVGATGARSPSQVSFSVKLPEFFSQAPDQKLNCRRVAIRVIATASLGTLTVTPVVNGSNQPSQAYKIPLAGDFEVFASFMLDGLRFSAIISGSGQLTLNRFTAHITSKEIGASLVVS
jgi:uncharacterized membrane protein YgcG